MTLLKDIRIDSLAHGGASVARTEDGRVAFIAAGCPGDIVDAEVVADKGRFVEAEIVRIVEPSPDRRTAPCPYFGTCGGCQWQHVSYAVQAASKQREVVDALTRIGRFEGIEVPATVSGPAPYGYRNRQEMRMGTGPDGRLVIGLMAARSDTIVPIDTCLLLPERARRMPKAISGALRYLAGRTPLDLERVSLRVASGTRDVEIDLWGAPGGFPRNAVSKTLSDAVRADVITRALVKGDMRERADAKVEVLKGKGYWREKLGDRSFRVSAPSFFQINSVLAATMQQMVLDALQPGSRDRVLDLYAGVGTFTLPLAEVAGEVAAIEGAGSAVRDLRANLEDAEQWADVLPGDAARALAEAGSFDLAVVDPPRSGMTPDALAALVDTGARRICYVSCDPATLARDARALTEAGYRLLSAAPVDLFPQTWHVETIAVLDRVRP